MFTTAPARAASSTWVGGGASAIWGGLANWASGNPADGAGFTATFGNAFTNGYNITVNTDRTIGNITFTDPANANNMILVKHASDFTLTLNNSGASPVINVTQSARSLAINCRVASTNGLTKNGPGTLTLGTTNTYSGNTIISAGTLTLGHRLAMQNSVLDTTTSKAGTSTNGLRATVATPILGGLSGNKNLADVFTTTSGGYGSMTNLTLNPAAGAAPIYSGGIADGAAGMSLTKTGAGSQTLAGTNTYSGDTILSAGKLVGVVGGSSASSTVILNAAAATNGVSITDNTKSWTCAALTATAAGVLEFSFGAVAPGTTVAPLVVSGAATFTATPTVRVVGSSLATGTYPLITWGSMSGTAPTALTVATLSPGTSASLSNSATALHLVIVDVPPIVKADNTDDLNLTNSWVGGVVPGAGDVARWDGTVTTPNTTILGTDATWAGMQIVNPSGLVTINAGSTLTLGAASTDIDLSAATADLTLNCPLALNAANVWDVATGRTLSLNGAVSGGFAVTKQGAGTAILSGTNTFSGTLTVSGGELDLGNWGGTTLGTVTVAGGTGATLGISGSATYSIASRMSVSTATGDGTVNQTGGTVAFTASDCLLVGTGAGSGSSGTYNLSGGTLTNYASATRGVMLGVNPMCSGTFNLSGTGHLNIPKAILMIGRSDVAASNSVALFNQTGGTATVGTLTIGGTGAGNTTSTMSLTAGTFVATNFAKLATAINDVAAIHIGGTADVTLPAFPTARGSNATATLTFDDGTLRPLTNSAAYLGGLTSARIKAGGVALHVDTGMSITITQALLTDDVFTGGGLNKTGDGGLTLSGTNTYTGGTAVSAGGLKFSTAGSAMTDVTVAGGATNGVLVATTGGQWVNTGSLTNSDGSSVEIDYGSTVPSTTVAPIKVNHFAAGTGLTLKVAGAGFEVGQDYPLVTWTGSGPVDASAFTTTVHPKLTGYLTNVGNTLYLHVTNLLVLSWNTGTGDWDTATPNWVDNSLASVAYSDTADAVLFGDASGVSGDPTINLASTLAPVSVMMNSTNHDYTISGTGRIGGPGPLLLAAANTRTLTLATTNSHTGGTTIRGGTLQLGNGAALGSVAGAIQNDASLVVNHDGAQTMVNAISGTGTLTKLGSGTLQISGASTYSGGTLIKNGTVDARTVDTFFGTGNVTMGGNGSSGAAFLTGRTPTNAFIVNAPDSGMIVIGANGTTANGKIVGPITLNGNLTLANPTNMTSGSLLVSGGVTGTGHLTLENLGTAGSTITLSSNAINPVGSITLQGASTGNATISADIGSNVTSVTQNGRTNTLVLSGTNSYSGGTTNSGAGGTVSANSDFALGTGPFTFAGGRRLVVATGVTVTNPIIIGANSGLTGRGLVEPGGTSGTATVSGPIQINNGAAAGGLFAAPTANTILHVAGVITSSVSVSARIGTVVFSGGGTGYTNLINNQGTIRVGATNGIATSATVNIGASAAGILDLNGFDQSLKGVVKGGFAATIGNSSTNADATLTITGTSTFGGTIQDTLGAGTMKVNLTVNGGALTLSGINAYTGATTVSNGTLVVNGSIGSGAIAVQAGGTLGGTGTVGGTVTNNGVVAPGVSAGLLTLSGGYVQTASGTLASEISGVTMPGTDYDQLLVLGTATLAGTLTVTTNGYAPVEGDTFLLLVASGGLTGTFDSTNLPPLTPTTLGWAVHYTNSAVVLSVTNGPASSTGYDAWSNLFLLAQGPAGDDDGDGYANLLEYVTGANPTNGASAAPMRATRTNGVFALQFTRDTNSIDATLIVEGVYANTNDAPWTGIATNLAGSWGGALNVVETGGTNPVNVSVADTDPSATNRFLRLRVTRP